MPLIKKIDEFKVFELTNKLCDKLLYGKEQYRDIASIALKTIIPEVTTTKMAEILLKSLTPQLIKGITSTVCIPLFFLHQF